MKNKLVSAFINSCHHVVSEIPQLLPIRTERNMVASSDLFSNGFKHPFCNAYLARDGTAGVRQLCTPAHAPLRPRSWQPARYYPSTVATVPNHIPIARPRSWENRPQSGTTPGCQPQRIKKIYSPMADAKTTSARHRFTGRQHPLSPCPEKLPALPWGEGANVGLLGPVPAPRWLDLSLSVAWRYGMMWKESSRDIPLSKGKTECKLSAPDH